MHSCSFVRMYEGKERINVSTQLDKLKYFCVYTLFQFGPNANFFMKAAQALLPNWTAPNLFTETQLRKFEPLNYRGLVFTILANLSEEGVGCRLGVFGLMI